MRAKEYLDQAEYDHWSQYSDFRGLAKTIGKYRVELLGGTDRGAEIIVWEPGYESLEYVFPPSDDKKMHRADTINFWYFSNAIAEYRELKSVRNLIDLMWRNM